MSESQRGSAAAKLADMPKGARSDLGPIGTMSAAQAADALNVGERSVKRAKAVRKCGSEKLVKAVEAGAMSVAAATALDSESQRVSCAPAVSTSSHTAPCTSIRAVR